MTAPDPAVQPPSPQPKAASGLLQFLLVAGLLLAALLVMFHRVLRPDFTLFANDGPLGQISATYANLPSNFICAWQDLNWLGWPLLGGIPNFAFFCCTVLGPLTFSKFYAPFTLLFLGVGAWCFLRQCKFSPAVCCLGALAAALNSDFFSTACWGVASQPLSFGLDFLALAALADETSPRRWIRVVLAGIAVGMGVTDAADIGALFSIFVAAFVVFQACNPEAEGEPTGGRTAAGVLRLSRGVARLAVVGVSALVVALAMLVGIFNTQIKGVAGMGQDAASKAERWIDATRWSLPKAEGLGILVPGLFGYRMDTPKGGVYWGGVARDPLWDTYLEAKKQGKAVPPPPAEAMIGFTGGGFYAGVLVVLVAAWGVAQSFRRTDPVFSPRERRFIWFWLAGAVVSLLMGFGRFAPFYQFFYALPFTSIIRNPAKFIHLFTWALIILFGYGLQGLSRVCFEGTAESRQGFREHWRAWWAAAASSDKNWIVGSALAVVAGAAGWVFYGTKRHALVSYLKELRFDQARSESIASFSLGQAAWFVLLLLLAAVLVAVALSGYFKNQPQAEPATEPDGRFSRLLARWPRWPRPVWGWLLLGLLMVGDLMLANRPWVIIYNWRQTYASNPILDFLAEKPFEQRVSRIPMERLFDLNSVPPDQAPILQNFFAMTDLYNAEWTQHLFQYYNIQSLDIIQMPRILVEYTNFDHAVGRMPLRRWELTNTRYLLGLAYPVDKLNELLDPVRKPFKLLKYFAVVPKAELTAPPRNYAEMTAEPLETGPCALYEFTAALPRAKLYRHWQVSTNTDDTLIRLGSPAFDPAQQVLVADPLPAPSAANPSDPAGTVEITSHAPKRVVLHAKAAGPSVLLLNDKYDPNWKVTVDGQPSKLLRCNYVMRGVQVPAGDHQVEFRFTASPIGLFALSVSVLGLAVGAGLLLLLGFSGQPEEDHLALELPSAKPGLAKAEPEVKR